MGIKVLIADDHELVRHGLRYAFHNTEIEIIAEAADREAVIRLVQEQPADVLLLDIGWPDGDGTRADGFDILREVKSAKPELPVVIYSMYDRPSYKSRCRELGASGYVVKGLPGARVVEVIRRASAGQDLWESVP
jgi:DNA-binding NarL/FixJ family response regulator